MISKTNKVVRVSFAGGILGLLFGSHRGKLESVIGANNTEGWNLAEVIRDTPNLAILFVRLLILISTIGLWTLSNGYVLVFEKPVAQKANSEPNFAPPKIGKPLRAEPSIQRSLVNVK